MLLKWEARNKRLQRRVIVMTQRGRGCGIPKRKENTANVIELTEMMRTMMARMDVIEAAKRRRITHVIRDDNDGEEEVEPIKKEQEEQMTIEKRMIRAINSVGVKPKLNAHVYSDSLNPKELIDWIREMEGFYEFEHIRDLRIVKFASTKLRSRASLRWDKL